MMRLWRYSKHQNKSVKVRNWEIPYQVEHRYVKHPRIEIKPDRTILLVLPPNKSNPEEILNVHKSWIYKKVSHIHNLIKGLDVSKKDIEKKFIFEGKPLDLTFDRGKYQIEREDTIMSVFTPRNVEGIVYLKNWIKDRLRDKLNNYSESLSKEIGVYYKKIYIRSQKTKWASCSSKGNISFNIRAGILPYELLEHLVLHELVHLRVGKHNKKFWTIVGKYESDYVVKEKELIGYWFLSHMNKLWNEII